MAGSLNRVLLIGNLGRNPEIRSTNDGRRIGNLNIATSESWKDKSSGEKREKTEWHRVVIFNEGLVDVAEKYLRKGSKVFLEGSLQTRKWTDNAGVERYSTEIVLAAYRGTMLMLDGASGGGNRAPTADSQDDYGYDQTPRERAPASRGGGSDGHSDLNDDIPF